MFQRAVQTSLQNLELNGAPWIPPDTTIAVGTDRIIVATNTLISIYTKDTFELISRTGGTFGSSLGDYADPWLVWDEYAKRFWFIEFAYGDLYYDIRLFVSKLKVPTQLKISTDIYLILLTTISLIIPNLDLIKNMFIILLTNMKQKQATNLSNRQHIFSRKIL